jgi:hypothetical protein
LGDRVVGLDHFVESGLFADSVVSFFDHIDFVGPYTSLSLVVTLGRFSEFIPL